MMAKLCARKNNAKVVIIPKSLPKLKYKIRRPT